MTNSQAHWQNVYQTKGEREVSWFQEDPAPSLELIARAGATGSSAIVDVGGGASRLVDVLLERGFQDVTVLDISAAALAATCNRLGRAAERATWIVGDMTIWRPEARYDIWHDRAAFHFLNTPEQQRAYAERLRQALKAGGHAVIGAFALDGPEKCSGLPVRRHSAESIAAVLGSGFALTDSRRHQHRTPWDSEQSFQFCTFARTE